MIALSLAIARDSGDHYSLVLWCPLSTHRSLITATRTSAVPYSDSIGPDYKTMGLITNCRTPNHSHLWSPSHQLSLITHPTDHLTGLITVETIFAITKKKCTSAVTLVTTELCLYDCSVNRNTNKRVIVVYVVLCMWYYSWLMRRTGKYHQMKLDQIWLARHES